MSVTAWRNDGCMLDFDPDTHMFSRLPLYAATGIISSDVASLLQRERERERDAGKLLSCYVTDK